MIPGLLLLPCGFRLLLAYPHQFIHTHGPFPVGEAIGVDMEVIAQLGIQFPDPAVALRRIDLGSL